MKKSHELYYAAHEADIAPENIWFYCPDCDEEYNLPENQIACPLCDCDKMVGL